LILFYIGPTDNSHVKSVGFLPHRMPLAGIT